MKNPAELPLVAITAVCARENGGSAETSAHTWVRIPEIYQCYSFFVFNTYFTMRNPAELPLVAITAVCAKENSGSAETSAHTWVRIPEYFYTLSHPLSLSPSHPRGGFFVVHV